MKIELQSNFIDSGKAVSSVSSDGSRHSVSAKQPEDEDSFASVLAEIREKGLVKYTEEKRTEELREELLAEMGLTEETLADMSVDRRMALEKVIAEEIQKRQEAARELGQDQPSDKLQQNPSLASLQGIGLKSAYFEVEAIMEEHLQRMPDERQEAERGSSHRAGEVL